MRFLKQLTWFLWCQGVNKQLLRSGEMYKIGFINSYLYNVMGHHEFCPLPVYITVKIHFIGKMRNRNFVLQAFEIWKNFWNYTYMFHVCHLFFLIHFFLMTLQLLKVFFALIQIHRCKTTCYETRNTIVMELHRKFHLYGH